MAEYLIQDSTLSEIGNAIREKDGTGALIPVANMASRIRSIQTGVTLPTLSDPAEENDVRLGKQYIDAQGRRSYGMLNMDVVLTPGWEEFIPVGIQYDSDDRYLVMTEYPSGGGGGGSGTEFAVTVYHQCASGLMVFCNGESYFMDGGTLELVTEGPVYIFDSSVGNYAYATGAGEMTHFYSWAGAGYVIQFDDSYGTGSEIYVVS